MRSGHAVMVAGVLGLSSLAVARDNIVLHEYIAPDVDEDLSLSSQAASGLPAAVKTPSGTISPPDLATTPDPKQTYQQSGQPERTQFRPDRDTRRPDIENYDDPFTPALTPFKRMYAYDAVREDYTLYVRDPEVVAIEVEEASGDDAERFFGDMSVALRAGELVRIPSVAPGARLLQVVTNPKTEVRLFRDSAENWFVRSSSTTRVRLVTHIAAERDVFASRFADVSWGSLPMVPPQPAAHDAAFRRVKKAIGVSRAMRPRQVVEKLVEYFRSFGASDEPP
ncbi:MAG: transglutaminase domain-containing protein, partial [Myxococcota bacterium]